LGEFVPPEAKWYMLGICSARGIMVYVEIRAARG